VDRDNNAAEVFFMALTPDTVKQVAHLARLTLSDEEVELFTRQLNDILNYVQKLNELDTTDVPAMAHVLELENAFREDAVRDSLPLEEALANAPDRQKNSFAVPKII
jgi:aspartyl-tRNA(Asn)/glutamyl-tRNA(Gln) amidotransferase subunit C